MTKRFANPGKDWQQSALPDTPSDQRFSSPVSASALQAQLSRILASPIFVNSERLSRFLRFTVERAAEGQTEQLKEYTLGLAVFDKKQTFDPRFDPIVRVEAGRLRARLKQYYESEGQHDQLLIDLPKGGYQPRFLVQDAPGTDSAVLAKPVSRSVAVLPFADRSIDRDQEYFCDGMTEELINALTKLHGLKVSTLNTALRLRGKDHDLHKIADQLNVGIVLAGSVRKSGDRIRITVQLIDVTEECYLWSEIYDRELQDVFSIQDEISQAVVAKLRIQLADGQSSHLIKRYTDDLEAYNLYLKGRYYWNQRSEQSLRKAIGYFEQAIGHEPRYAPAYSGLADSYSLLGNYGVLPARDVKSKAINAARKAVEIDPTLAEAHAALGHVNATYCWDWAGARSEYQQAMALNHSYATVHHWYAMTYLTPLGLREAALDEIGKAEELDPVSASIKRDAAIILYNLRRFDRAIERCEKAIGLDSEFYSAYWAMGMALEGCSRYQDAVEAFQHGLRLAPESPRLLGALAHARALCGQKSEAFLVLDSLTSLSAKRYVSPFDFALIHVGLGDHDSCFHWLKEACESRCYELVSIKVDPRFDAIRGDTRYRTLLKQLRLDTALD